MNTLSADRFKPGEYFMLPKKLFQLDLKDAEIAIYAYLMRLENRQTYQCWPSYRAIGKAVGIKHNDTVMKYVRSLEEKCLIYTEPTTVHTASGKHWNGNLRYTIRPIEDAWEHHQRVQMEENSLKLAKLKAEERTKKRKGKGGV